MRPSMSNLIFFENGLKLLPAEADIPRAFFEDENAFRQIARAWFCTGITGAAFVPKEGIDKQRAIAHLSAVLRSFDPSHEHKMAGVAYLMSEWFERVDLPHTRPQPRKGEPTNPGAAAKRNRKNKWRFSDAKKG